LFIDNPVGTGLSYADFDSDIPNNEDMVATQFLYGLNQLYFNENGCF